MPLYQFWCEKCAREGRKPDYEVTMSLETFEGFTKKLREVRCPGCNKRLRHLISPPRRIQIR